MSELDSHVKYPDRLKVILDEAGVRYELVPHPQPGAFGIVAVLLETDDGCMDIEEQNEAAYQACLKIAQATLRYASSDLRGILRDEFVAMRARAEAAEAKVKALVEDLRKAHGLAALAIDQPPGLLRDTALAGLAGFLRAAWDAAKEGGGD